MICDVTEAVEAEERFERMFNANPAPAVIVRVADLRYVRVNEGFLQLSGHKHDDLVGHSLYDLDILAGAEQRDLAKARLAEWRTIPQMEAELPLPSGDTKLVILAGHPIEMRDERCSHLHLRRPGAAASCRGGAPPKRGAVAPSRSVWRPFR